MEDYYEKMFQMDIEVPEVVMQKAEDAFSQIAMHPVKREDTSKMNNHLKNKKPHFYTKQVAAAVAICTLALGGATVIAATHHIWSRGMQGRLQATDEQQQTLIEDGVAASVQEDYAQLAVTDGNITITPETVIVDERFAHLSFAVSGYTLGEGIEPCFENVYVYQGDDVVNSHLNMSGSFYDGIVADENGSPVYDDGEPLQYDAGGEIVTHYTDENGNLEYVITAMASEQDDTLLGKTIHVDFENLGTVYKADYDNAVDGNWSFDFDLSDVSVAKSMQIDQQIEGTDFTLHNIELSPISIKLNYSVNGEVTVSGDENGVPYFCGVVLKDGTRIPFLADGGSSGYTDETMAEAYEWSGFDRVISVDQVDALLIKPEGSTEPVEISVS